MPSKAECPLNKRQAPLLSSPSRPRSRRFHRLSKNPPYQTANKEKKKKNEERIINFQRPIGQR